MKNVPLIPLGLALALLIVVPAEIKAQRRLSAVANDYVTGRVTVRDSSPARSWWVMVYDGAGEKGRSLTGDDGRYYIGGLDKKTYTIVVRKQMAGSDLARAQFSLPANRVFNIRLP